MEPISTTAHNGNTLDLSSFIEDSVDSCLTCTCTEALQETHTASPPTMVDRFATFEVNGSVAECTTVGVLSTPIITKVEPVVDCSKLIYYTPPSNGNNTTSVENQLLFVNVPQGVTIKDKSTIAPKLLTNGHTRSYLTASERERKRKLTHNEVERRRRDKINAGLSKISSVIPNCIPYTSDQRMPQNSKGLILNKAVEHINHLTEENNRLLKELEELSSLKEEVNRLKNDVSNLRQENSLLKNKLHHSVDLHQHNEPLTSTANS